MQHFSKEKQDKGGYLKPPSLQGLAGGLCLFCVIVSVQNTDERPGKYNVHSNLEHTQRSALVHAWLRAEQVHLDFCEAMRGVRNRQWMQL